MMKSLLCLLLCVFLVSAKRNSKRPKTVNVGAILSFDSYIGRAARIAIELAVKDVNANASILRGTQLVVSIHDSNCSGFLGMVEALQYMESEVMAIIGPQSSVVAHVISHAANELQVPLVSFGATDPTLNSLQFPFFVRAVQSDFYQMAAVANVVSYFSWKLVIAIYIDNDYGRNGVAALSQTLATYGGKISEKFGIPDTGVFRTDVLDYLVKVSSLESRVIVLHAYPEMGLRVFAAAKYLGMMGNGYVWIATDWLSTVLDSSNAPPPDEIVDILQGVICLRQHTPPSNDKKSFKSRWDERTNRSIGLNQYGLYAYDTVWLIARAIDKFFASKGTPSFSRDSRLNEFRLGHFSIFDSGKLLLSNIKKEQFTGLTGLFRFNPDGDLVHPAYDVINVIGTGFRIVGYWSNSSGLSTTPPELLTRNQTHQDQVLHGVVWPGDSLFLPRGWAFPNNGKQLRIGVPVRTSFREFVMRVPNTDTFKGFCIDVFLAAVNLLPYAVPYQFVPQGDGKANPSYTGMVNKIYTGELDAVIGDVAIVTNRTKIVDFTQPYAASGLVVVAPFKKLNSGAWAFLRPFSMSLWIVSVCFFLVVGIVVWILEHRINDEFRGPPRKQIITVLWFSLSTMFFAHRENTVSTLGRMVLIIWLFVVLIINSSYTASLTSILTVQQLSSPIKGIETLREGDEPIGFQVGSFAENYLKTELGIDKSRLVALGSPEEYTAALLQGPQNGGVAAIVDERPYMELFLSSHCSFRIVGQEFTKSGWGFAFPRDSPLAVDFSTAILRLSENGDLQRIHDEWLMGSTCSSDAGEIDSTRLYLKSFWGLFLICGVTFFVALSIYIVQIIQQMNRTAPAVESSLDRGSGRSRRLQRLLSLMDEKKEVARGTKRRKTESSASININDEPGV